MTLLSYFKNVDRNWQRDNTGALGILLNTERGFKFYEIGTDGFNELVNADWFKSFSCQVDIGSCTFSKEFRISGETTKGYWYASKRINCKLRRVYFGNKVFTLDAVQAVLSKFTESNDVVVTQKENCVTDETKAIAPDVCIELAGNGKNPNHLQPSLLPATHELAMLKSEVADLKRLLDAEMQSVVKAQEEVRQVQRDRLAIIKQRDAIAKEFAEYQEKHRNVGLAVAISQERIQELETTIDRQADLILALRTDVDNHREEGATYYKQLEQERWESSRREEQVQGYYFMHEELSEEVMKYRTLIEKYRLLAEGKDKRNHPRFAYMIDFLAEIDKLS